MIQCEISAHLGY